MHIHEDNFTVPFDHHAVQGDLIYSENDVIELVLLHGAGIGSRDRYQELRKRLAQRSIGSMAFDFVGFGETGGSIHESSLQKRTEQACAMIEAMNIKSPICLLGSSMGAYTAVKLSEILPTNGIILFVPAMYDLAAYSAPFGDEFSQIIRKPNSWVNSDAWQILQAFRGRLLVVTAGQDDVIPQDVIRRIDEAAANTSWKEVYTVQHSSHMLIQYLEQNPSEFDHVVGLIQHCVKGK